MLILTENGDAVNATHIVHFFVQRNGCLGTVKQPVIEHQLVMHLTGRQRVVAADKLDIDRANSLFQDVVRQWTRAQACIDITACLKRLGKDATCTERRLHSCPSPCP